MLHIKNTVYVSIGSNLGERRENVEKALNFINQHPKIIMTARSKWYQTEPLKKKKEDSDKWFINGVIKLKTSLGANDLLHALQKIESDLGRPLDRNKWDPRTIDLDILYFNNNIINENHLKVPHPEITKRRFVLKPLCDISSSLKDPKTDMQAKDMLEAVNDDLKII